MYKLEKSLNNGNVCEDLLRKEIPILSNSSLSEHAFFYPLRHSLALVPPLPGGEARWFVQLFLNATAFSILYLKMFLAVELIEHDGSTVEEFAVERIVNRAAFVAGKQHSRLHQHLEVIVRSGHRQV